MNQDTSRGATRLAIDIAIQLGLIFILLAWCLQIIQPFGSLILWGAIIAIALYHPFLALRDKLGGRRKLALTVLAVLGLAVVLLPAILFAESVLGSVSQLRAGFEQGSFHVPPPSDSVKEWPLIGEKLYAAWSGLASDLAGWLTTHSDDLRPIVVGAFGKVANLSASILGFVVSIFIAIAFLANAESAEQAARRFARRLMRDDGDEMIDLASATVKSITVGVLGIAVIQALLGGVGMLLAGVPGAGLWALFILILAIAQLPPLIILLPAIIYVFSDQSTGVAIVFAIWSVAVSFSDAVLKPLLLGRGVNAPMLVILLGAIGGMITSGIVGLFVGAVVLALGYKLFQAWVAGDIDAAAADEG